MASCETNNPQGNSASLFLQAWKSVKKHFPNSNVEKHPETNTSSIILHPIQNIDLVVEFCFNEKNAQVGPQIHLRSCTLSDSFLDELKKIFTLKCSNLTDWQNLGDEIETIIQCVEIKRERKVHKKNKKSVKNKRDKDTKNVTNSSLEDDGEQNLSQTEIVPVLHVGLNLNCQLEEKKPRPNYFIAIRIHNKDIISNIANVQSDLVRKEGLLTKGVIPSEALHLTLCNLGLDSATDLLLAIEAINQMKLQLQEVLPRTPFIVHSVSKFFNRAIYAKVETDEDFHVFRNLMIKNLDKAGIEFREDHEVYNPHITIIKVRRPERKEFGNRHIEPFLYSDYVDATHGEQRIDAVYLCAMGGQKREDGFYITACDIHFDV